MKYALITKIALILLFTLYWAKALHQQINSTTTPQPCQSGGAGYHTTTMKLTAWVCVSCIAAAVIPLAGCSTGLSEAQVQAMIDKTIDRRMGAQAAETEDPPSQAEAAAAASTFTPDTSGPAFSAESNPEVDDRLNQADLAFRKNDEEWGCQRVSSAIGFAADKAISASQSSQLSSYAARCNLRY